jgi:hypothetical protein
MVIFALPSKLTLLIFLGVYNTVAVGAFTRSVPELLNTSTVPIRNPSLILNAI